MSNSQIPVSELRDRLSAVVDELPTHRKAIQLTRHGKPVAILMAYDAFEALIDDLDDADDYRALAEHDATTDPDDSDTIPWELAARDLGVA